MRQIIWSGNNSKIGSMRRPNLVRCTGALCCLAALLMVGGCKKTDAPIDSAIAKEQPTASSPASDQSQLLTTPPTSVVAQVGEAPDSLPPDEDSTVMDGEGVKPAADVVSTWEPRGDWTTQRLIVLGEQGPWLVDLAISIAGKSLEQASLQQQMQLTDELLEQLGSPASWDDLLQLPLVRSGWLGNLVPTEEQRQQLISMYDTQRDGTASREELPPFLSRGLARAAPLQLSDLGFASDHDPRESPWGPADRNRDFSLDSTEQKEFAAIVARRDLDANSVLDRSELTELADRGVGGMMAGRPSGLLQANTVLLTEPGGATQQASQADPRPANASGPSVTHLQADSAQTRKLASELLRHYTFLTSLSREQWPDWNDERWQAVDPDEDGHIDREDLQQWLAGPAQVQLYVTLPSFHPASGDDETESTSVHVQKLDPSVTWQPSAGGGQLICGCCAIRVQVSDVFNGPRKKLLRQQLQQALANPQLRTFLQMRLELNATAFDLVDVDQNDQLSDSEFDQVWRWLSGRSGGRVAGRWMLSAHPWFQLADMNADERLSEWELQSFCRQLPQFDRNGDGLLTPNELPLVTTLTLARSDPRLELELPSGETVRGSAQEEDWFSAMDANRDGAISSSEFLGEKEDFTARDSDQDGFLSRGEVSLPKASN